jgi:hypothetical protein
MSPYVLQQTIRFSAFALSLLYPPSGRREGRAKRGEGGQLDRPNPLVRNSYLAVPAQKMWVTLWDVPHTPGDAGRTCRGSCRRCGLTMVDRVSSDVSDSGSLTCRGS